DLSARQEELNREVRAWATVEPADRQRMADILLQRNVADASQIATSAAELQDRYQSWLPLQREAKDASVAAVSKKVQEIATAAAARKSEPDKYGATAQHPAPAAPAPAAPGAEANNAAKPPAAPDARQAALDQMINSGEAIYTNLTQLEVVLRQLASREDQADVA